MGDYNFSGVSLIISDDVLNRLDKVDEKLKEISESSEHMRKTVVDSFNNMGVEADKFAKKIDLLQKNIDDIDFSKLGTGLNNSALSAENLANAVVKVTQSLANPPEAELFDPNKVAITENSLEAVNEKIRTYKRLLQENRQFLVDETQQRNATTYIDEINRLTVEYGKLNTQKKISESYDKTMSLGENTEAQRANKLAKLSQLYEKMALNSGKYADELDKIRQAQDRLNKSQAAQSKLTTYDGALDFSKNAFSVEQRTKAIKYLTEARNKLKSTDDDYTKQLTTLNSKILEMNKLNAQAIAGSKELKKQHSSLMDTSGQLARRLALVFSVSQITGYISKMMEVRGEFELQQRALQSILQSKDQADKLFSQITELAVKSPFQVKELVTYTKQLASYRIETSKLYDTTKRLADISAGLGIDMSRLVLALGQVKAANYLRGQELRQFSESGINILGELSKYFTEIKGQMVTVGDVFQMVSNRMVKFSDVEEVFKRLTNEGGIFFNMQEVQAETLRGQLSNLRDTIDLMFNDIGKANDGVLKEGVGVVKDLVSNWKEVKMVLEPVLLAFIALKGNSLLLSNATKSLGTSNLWLAKQMGFVNGLTMEQAQAMTLNKESMQSTTVAQYAMGKGMLFLQSAIKGIGLALKSLAPYLIIAGVAELYTVLTRASRQAEELKKRLSEIGYESSNNIISLSTNFERLANTVLDVKKSTTEQNNALKTLKNTYAEYLPTQTLTIEGLKAMKGNYDSVTRAIYDKIEAQNKEKALQAVQDVYGKDAVSAMDDLVKKLKDYNIATQDARTIVNEFKKQFDAGMIKSPEEAQNAIQKLIKDYTNMAVKLSQIKFVQQGGLWGSTAKVQALDEITDFFSALSLLKSKSEEVSNMNITPFVKGGGTQEYKEIQAQLDEITKSVEKWKEQNANKLNPFELQEGAKKYAIEQYEGMINTLNDKLKGLNPTSINFQVFKKGIQDAQAAINDFTGTKLQQEMNGVLINIAKLNHVNLNGLMSSFLGAEESVTEQASRIKKSVEAISKSLSYWNAGLMFASGFASEEDKKKAEGILKVLSDYLKLIDITNKKDNNGKNVDLDKERLALLKQMVSQYDKLTKYYSADEASQKIRVANLKEMQRLGLSEINTNLTNQEYLKALEGLKQTKDVIKEISRVKMEIEIEVKEQSIKTSQDKLDNLFSGYELGVEIESEGLDKDLFGDLFGIKLPSRDELKQNFKDLESEYKNGGKEIAQIYENGKTKLNDIDKKYYQGLVKKYAQFSASTEFERKKVEKEFSDANDYIFDAFTKGSISQDQFNKLSEKIKKGYRSAIRKIDWKEFSSSNDFAKAFGDTENASNKTLTNGLEKLKGNLKKAISDNDVINAKQYVEQIEKLYNTLNEREDVFVNLKNKLKNYNKALEAVNDTTNTSGEKYDNYVKSVNELDKAITAAQSVVEEFGNQLADVTGKAFGDEIGKQTKSLFNFANALVDAAKMATKANKIIDKTIDKTADAVDKIGDAGDKTINSIGDAANLTSKSVTATAATAGKAISVVEKASIVLGVVSAALEILQTISDVDKKYKEEQQDMMDDIIRSQIEYNKALLETKLLHEDIFGSNPFGNIVSDIRTSQEAMESYITAASEMQEQWQDPKHNFLGDFFSKVVKGVDLFGTFGGFMNLIKDTKLQPGFVAAIDNLRYITQKGSKGFLGVGSKGTKTEDLNAWVKNNLGADLFDENGLVNLAVTDDLLSNHADRLTDDTKRTLETLKMYAEKIKDVEESIKSWATDVFGDLSTNLSDALVESFRNGEDAADNFGTHVSSILEKLGQQMIQNMLYENVFKQYQGQLEDLTKKYALGQMTQDEYMESLAKLTSNIMDSSTAFTNVGVDFLDKLKEAAKEQGIDIYQPTNSESKLSGLSQGIQGVTEDTAEALESLLNSMRFFVADNNKQLQEIYRILSSNSSEVNPILGELRLQTAQITAINKLLNSVSKSGHSKGGYGLKVFMD